jgi:hypothetical protein
MRETQLTIPEIALIAATRGILGAGIGFLLADQVPEGSRKILGWTLFSLGALSTIPLALTVFGRSRCDGGARGRPEQFRQPQRESDDRLREETLATGI